MVFSHDLKHLSKTFYYTKLFHIIFNLIIYIFTPIYGFCFTIYNDIFDISDYIMHKLGRKKIIFDKTDKQPYLIRYYLLFTKRSNFPFNIFLHHIVKDDQQELHDYPWGFFSLVLKGGYYETILIDKQYTETHWRAPGTFQCVNANHIHRISIPSNNTGCWTLFIPFKKQKQWGFWSYNKYYNKRITRSLAANNTYSINSILPQWIWTPSIEYLQD